MRNHTDMEHRADVPDGRGDGERAKAPPPALAAPRPREIDGPPGPEPTRYGDWEAGGRCIDF